MTLPVLARLNPTVTAQSKLAILGFSNEVDTGPE